MNTNSLADVHHQIQNQNGKCINGTTFNNFNTTSLKRPPFLQGKSFSRRQQNTTLKPVLKDTDVRDHLSYETFVREPPILRDHFHSNVVFQDSTGFYCSIKCRSCCKIRLSLSYRQSLKTGFTVHELSYIRLTYQPTGKIKVNKGGEK